MKLSPNFLVPFALALVVAMIAASHATFGGVKPDMSARDLLPGQPANATNR